MYRRFIEKRLQAALADTRVVLLNGARQTGKSTLAQQLAAQRGGQYLTLDDPAAAGLARSDPSALVRGAGDFTVIDAAKVEVARRQAAMMPDEEKIKSADYVIDNSGAPEEAARQVEKIYAELRKLAAEKGK